MGRERSKCNSFWPGMLLPVYGMIGCGGGCWAKKLVGKRKRILLRRLNLHHEALDIAAISADFCTESTGPSLLHCPVSDLVEPDLLYCHWILCTVPMHTKRKDLEPVGSWYMPQLCCYISLRWHPQHHLRLFDSGAPSGFNVATGFMYVSF